jgi:hypothetical protein
LVRRMEETDATVMAFFLTLDRDALRLRWGEAVEAVGAGDAYALCTGGGVRLEEGERVKAARQRLMLGSILPLSGDMECGVCRVCVKGVWVRGCGSAKDWTL